MANYAIVNTAKMAATNVDAYNLTGIYTTGDLENGVLVTLGAMGDGYEFAVTPATAATATDAYIIASPEVPVGLENLYVDPREFINKAGKPLALKRIVKGDFIELSGVASLVKGQYAVATADGKLVASSTVATNKICFKVEKLTKIAVGQDMVDAALLRAVTA